MVDRIGIIDLGSNTFHLLIVEIGSNQTFKTIHKERCFVGLAENGIEVLSQKAIDKGLETLATFKTILEDHKIENFKVAGTAALRSAKNKDVFINAAKDQLGLIIEVIDGEREADLIFKGVSLLHKMNGNYIIMDIGGGSVEFIVVKNSLCIWSKSYDIGVGVLHNKYHTSDPISKVEISQLIAFLYSTLEELKSTVQNLNIDALIGASGSFEVVESINGNTISDSNLSEVSLDNYWNVSSRIIEASLEERSQMEGLPNSRIKLIVVAMILIDVVIEMTNPNKIMISPYALKEGLLSELFT